MKYALVGLLLCGGIAAYFKLKPEPPAAPAPEPVAVATPKAKSKPIAVAPSVPDATPSFLAPPGVYFLLAATKVTGEDGVIGFRAGTQLQKIGDDEYASPTGTRLKLAPNQVTKDLRVQAQIAQNEATAQNALARRQQEELVATAALQKRAATETASAKPTPRTVTVPAAAPSAPNALERSSYGEQAVRRNTAVHGR